MAKKSFTPLSKKRQPLNKVTSKRPTHGVLKPYARGKKNDLNYAQRLAELEYGPQRRQINRNKRQITRDTLYNLGLLNIDKGQDTNSQRAYGELADKRIEQIYAALQDQLKSGASQQQQLYDTAMGAVAKNSDAAIAATQGATDAARQQMIADAQRLGLDAGLTDPLSKLTAEMEGTRARGVTSGSSAINNLLSRGTDVASGNITQQGDTAREGAQSRVGLMNRVQGELARIAEQYGREAGDIRHEGFTSRLEGNEQLSELAKMKGLATKTAYKELRDARTEKERQTALDKLAEEMQRGSLDLQRDQLGHTKWMDRQELDLARDQFGFGRKESNRNFRASEAQRAFNNAMALKNDARASEAHELNKQQIQQALKGDTLSPIERQMLRAELRKTNAEIRKLNAEARGGGSAKAVPFRKAKGMKRYLAEKIPKSIRAGVSSTMDTIINEAHGTSNGLAAAHRIIAREAPKQGWKPGHVRHLKNMVDIYYNNYE